MNISAYLKFNIFFNYIVAQFLIWFPLIFYPSYDHPRSSSFAASNFDEFQLYNQLENF